MIGRILTILALTVIIFCIFWAMPVKSHSWYSAQAVPANGAPDWYKNQGCCYGDGEYRDCDHAPEGSVREVSGGFIVMLTKEQMLQIRPSLKKSSEFNELKLGIVEFVPAQVVKPALDGAYSVCLREESWAPEGGQPKWIICFFHPTNS